MAATLVVKKGYVFISYSYNYEQKLFSTAVKVENKDQVDDTGKVHRNQIKAQSLEDKTDTNKIQDKLSFFKTTLTSLEAQQIEPTVQTVVLVYDAKYSKKKDKLEAKKSNKLWYYLTPYLAEKQKNGISEGSHKEFTKFFNRLQKEVFNYRKIKVTEVGQELAVEFRDYYINKNIAISTLNTCIAMFKNYIKYLLELELITIKQAADFNKSVKFLQYENETDVALSKPELKLISTFNELTPLRLRMRDALLAQIYLGGLRYSDFARIAPKHFDRANRIITLRTKKTRKTLLIPVIDEALVLINKYIDESNPDQPIFNTRNISSYNFCLRKIAETIYYLDDNGEKVYPFRKKKQVIIQTISGDDKIKFVPFFKIFKSSIARRTFITTMLKDKFDFTLIAKITGHSTTSSFKRYIKLANEDKVNIISNVFRL